MTFVRRNFFEAVVFGLAVLAASPPVSAAERAGSTLWDARWQYVRLVARDGGSPNLQPAHLTKAQIRSGLAQLKLDLGGEEAEDLLTPQQRDFYADQLERALAKAGPDQDVVICSAGVRPGSFGLREQKLTTTRLFVDRAGLNVIVGEALLDQPAENSYVKADPRLVSFADGQRAGPVHAHPGWTLAAGDKAVTIKRSDWAVIPVAAMAIPIPGTPEAEQGLQQEMRDIRAQVQQLRGQPAQPTAPAGRIQANPLEERLRILDDLKAKGMVTPEEYAAKRRQILDSL